MAAAAKAEQSRSHGRSRLSGGWDRAGFCGPGYDRGGTVETVWNELGVALQAFVRRRISNRDEADDVVGDVLLRIHEHLGSVGEREKVTSWVFRIARNAIVDHYRRAGRRRERPIARPELVIERDADGWLVDQDAALSELAGCIRPFVEALPPDYRRAIELADLGGRSQAEAARIEGISVSGMKSRVQRGRRQLAALVARCCHVTLDSGGRLVDFYQRPHGRCCEPCRTKG
jgi:RNA polymerase sigma-70 factor, ECF subfamily